MARNKYLIIHGTADDNMEAIAICGNALQEAGIVQETFAKKCQLREKDYPTGLPTEIPVAIPHCKDEGISENGICFLKLEKPVRFYRMDDELESIETDMVFNMAIKNPDEHLEALQNLMGFLSDADALIKCRDMTDDEVTAYLEEKIG